MKNYVKIIQWKISYTQVLEMIRFAEHKMYRAQLHDERTEQDGIRFAGLKPVEVSVKVDGNKVKPISEHLIGIFFEDINYAADGGLYAELVQNRDFEYSSQELSNSNCTLKKFLEPVLTVSFLRCIKFPLIT